MRAGLDVLLKFPVTANMFSFCSDGGGPIAMILSVQILAFGSTFSPELIRSSFLTEILLSHGAQRGETVLPRRDWKQSAVWAGNNCSLKWHKLFYLSTGRGGSLQSLTSSSKIQLNFKLNSTGLDLRCHCAVSQVTLFMEPRSWPKVYFYSAFVCFALWWNIAFFPAFFKELFENKLVKIMQNLFPSLHKVFGVNQREISKNEITWLVFYHLLGQSCESSCP